MLKQHRLIYEKFLCFVCIFTVVALHNIQTEAERLACTAANQKFPCHNRLCIFYKFVCDGEDDCGDNSDEVNCANKTCNATLEHRCDNGLCVSVQWLCDEHDDCKDGSDEKASFCDNRQCKENELHCGKKCIPNTWVCDGDADCDDKSDERDCPAPQCHNNEFQCNDTECITQKWKCDGENDCEDGSDEFGCTEKTCPETDFKCASGHQCIPKKWQCDNDPDCEDQSDEQNCDEPKPKKCPYGFASCVNDRTCILTSWICDGDDDCPDASDEKNCNGTVTHCTHDQFACDARHCISTSAVCDGNSDCSDGSDERNCPGNSTCDGDDKFRCSSGLCISTTKLCDRVYDCPDREDEARGFGKCGVNECLNNNGNCTHVCTDQPYSYRCDCHRGYRLVDKTICDDVDECSAVPSVCSFAQTCVNRKGSYKCVCRDGYTWDKGNCKPRSSDENMSIVLSDRVAIRRINLDSGKFMSVVASRLKHAVGVALHVRNRTLFWTDVTVETITRLPAHMQMTSSFSQPPVSNIYSMSMDNSSSVQPWKVKRSPMGLAVDWINNHLYWTDISLETISVSHTNGSWRTTLVRMRNEEPRFIALHPGQGYMFVSTVGLKSIAIVRFNMDGMERKDIITRNIQLPSGLTIDYESNKLFWVDAKLNALSSCDLDGRNRKTVLNVYQHLQRPFGIAVFAEKVYWTDMRTHSLRSCGKWDGDDVKVIDGHLHAPMDIQVDHPRTQPDLEFHCAGHTCPYICIPKPVMSESRYVCVCPDGFKDVNEDGRICQNDVTSSPTSTTTPNTIAENSPSSSSSGHTTFILLIIVLVVVIVFTLAFFGMRWYKRRSIPLSMNFDNPVYRKTTTSTPDENATSHYVSMPRSDSRIRLVNDDGNERQRSNSVDSATSSGHVYKTVGSVPVDGDDLTSQLSFNFMSDERRLVADS